MSPVRVHGVVVVLGLGALVVAMAVVLMRAPFQTDDSRVRPSATDVTVVRNDPIDVYDPVRAGEPTPPGYRQLLTRDQILPIYDPVFTSASLVDWPAEMLVIGISGEETAKAYPVTHLNQREMVIDSLEGLPLLVSW